MTTHNPTNTFKDTLSHLTFTYCVQNNIKIICAQSSGNTASSFIRYAAHTEVKLILFYLRTNSYKIDPSMVTKNVTLIEVEGSEPELKTILDQFSKASGIPIMPNLEL
jgi:threonine synthase